MASPNEESKIEQPTVEEPKVEEPEKAKGSSKALMVSGIALIVGVLAGGGAALHFKGNAAPSDKNKTAENAEPVESVSEEEAANSLISLAPFVVNLKDDQADEMHYLKCAFSVQLAKSTFSKTLENRTPKVRNDLILFLSSLKLSETEGFDNKGKILAHARETIRTVVGKEAISDVYMTEFVIQ